MSIRYQVAAGSRAVPASRVGRTHSVRQMHGPTGVLVDSLTKQEAKPASALKCSDGVKNVGSQKAINQVLPLHSK